MTLAELIKNPPKNLTLSQYDLVHTLKLYILKTHFNITLQTAPTSP